MPPTSRATRADTAADLPPSARPRASTSSGFRASRRSTRRASTRRVSVGAVAGRWRVPHARATSTASPRWWPSSSRSSAPSAPTSARRTPSRSWSSTAWPATSRCRPESSPAPPCARPTAWRSRRATSISRPRSGAPLPCSGGRSQPARDAWAAGERDGDACAALMAGVLADGAAGRRSSTSPARTPRTLRGARAGRWPGAALAGGPSSGRRGSSTTSGSDGEET